MWNFHLRRYNRTLDFITKHFADRKGLRVLDLGTKNAFSEIMINHGFAVTNTQGEDLDLHFEQVAKTEGVELVTALEILEHLVSPFPLLRDLPANHLFATIPLRLWFAPAYKSKTDKWDKHYHEFEDWQFDMLLEKAGWTIVDRAKWTSPIHKLGIRPILRMFTPRYYAVYAVRL